MAALPPLRPHQVDALDRLRAAARRLSQQKPGWGLLLQAPTAFGKTRAALDLATTAAAKGRRTLWLAGRTELIEQPVDKLRECGWTDVRVVQADRTTGDGPIVVASVQTLLARGLDGLDPDWVIMDEARHFLAPQWSGVPEQLIHVPRVGLDATPAQRGQAGGVPLGFLFDELVVGASMEALRADGWLLPCKHIALDRDAAKKQPAGHLWAEPVDALREHAPGTSSLWFCSSRKHARKVAEELRADGIDALAIDANTPSVERRRAVDALRSGELQALCNVGLFVDGFDCPAVQTIGIARKVSEVWTLIQMIGRGLRPASGRAAEGELCTVLDLASSCHSVCAEGYYGGEDRTWSLDGRACRAAKEALPVAVQCRQCHAWSRGGSRCPVCGAVKPPPPMPKISKKQAAEQRRKERAERTPRVGPAWDHYVEAVRWARRRAAEGRPPKPQAVNFRFKARFGHWPPWRPEQVEA